MSEPTTPSQSPAPHHRRGLVALVVIWAIFGVRIGVAIARREALSGDLLSLMILAFAVVTAVLGSRIWLMVHDARARRLGLAGT